MSQERRRHMRFNADIDGEFRVRGTDISGILMTDNFSKSGFKAVLNRGVNIDTILDCEMVFPQTIMPFFASGRIVWVKQRTPMLDSQFDVGVQLEEMDTVEKQFLIDYCYKHWSRSKRQQMKKEFDIET